MREFETFYDILTKQEKIRQVVKLPNREACEKFLCSFSPIEEYLRNVEHVETIETLWNNHDFESEEGRFGGGTSLSVMADRHNRICPPPSHKHDYFQITCVYRGALSAEINEGQYTLGPGDILMLSPGVVHRVQCMSDGTAAPFIDIRKTTFPAMFSGFLGEDTLLSGFFRRALYTAEGGTFLIFHCGEDVSITECILDLVREAFHRAPYHQMILSARLTELFCRLARDYTAGVSDTAPVTDKSNIGYILRYIKENYQTVTLEELAGVSGYAKTYLCRMIKNKTGKNFTELLNDVRIGVACNLLRSTELSISEVASHAGFNTDEHFYRTFRAAMNTTPQRYRIAPQGR